MANPKFNDTVATLINQKDEISVAVDQDYSAETRVEIDWAYFFSLIYELQKAVKGRSEFSGVIFRVDELQSFAPEAWKNKGGIEIKSILSVEEGIVDALVAHGVAFPKELPIWPVFPELATEEKVACYLIPDITAKTLNPEIPANVAHWNNTKFSDVFEVMSTEYFTYFPDKTMGTIKDILRAVTLYSYYWHRKTNPYADDRKYLVEFPQMTINELFLEVCANMDIAPTLLPLWFYDTWKAGLEDLCSKQAFNTSVAVAGLDVRISIGPMFFSEFTTFSNRLWLGGVGEGWRGYTGDVYWWFSRNKK